MQYSNPRMEAVIKDWPTGSKRTTAVFAVEAVKGKGERGTRFTIDPKTGQPSTVKKLTYASKARIVDGDDGRTYIIELSAMYRMIVVMRGDMKFQEEVIHHSNAAPRYDAMLALFNAT